MVTPLKNNNFISASIKPILNKILMIDFAKSLTQIFVHAPTETRSSQLPASRLLSTPSMESPPLLQALLHVAAPDAVASPRGNPGRMASGTRRGKTSLGKFAIMALAASGAASASAVRCNDTLRADLALPEPVRTTAHDFLPLLSRTEQAAIESPEQSSVSSLFETDWFQNTYATPLGATAIGLAAASLPFTYLLGVKRRRSPGAQEDIEAAARPAEPASAPGTRALPPAELERRASTLPPSRRFSAMLARAATGIWKQTDLYTALHSGDDREFREQLTNPTDGHVSLIERKAQLRAWSSAIERLALPHDLKKHFRDSVEDTISAIDDLLRDTNPWTRGMKLIAQAILCTPLPIVLPLFAVPIQRQQVDVIIASYVKTTMLRIGLATRATGSGKAINNIYLNRDYANIIQNIALSLNLFSETRGIANNPVYSVGAAVVSAVVLAYTFYPDQVKSLPAGIAHLVKQAASYITGSQRPSAKHAVRVAGVRVNDVADESRTRLHELGREVFAAREDIASQRSGFTESGKSLSDTADWQFGQMLTAYHKLGKELEAFTMPAEHAPRRVHDPDRAAKLTLAILSGVICGGVAAEFYQNTITEVDMDVDTLFNIYNGLNKAFDPNVSWQESLDTFKNWTSLSLVMAPMQAGNLGAGNPVQRSDKNMLIGAGALTAANLLVAGPFGALVKAIVSRALSHARASERTPSMEMTPGTRTTSRGGA